MQTRWRDTVIVDYEIGLPEHAAIEWELYSRSLLRIPRVLLGDHVELGRQRRPGIVDIPASLHDDVAHRVAEMTFDLAAVARLARLAENLFRDVTAGLVAAEQRRRVGIPAELIDGMLEVMALHVVNWLWPLDRFTTLASSLLGEHLGNRAVLSLLVPSEPAHIIDFHRYVLASTDEAATDPHAISAVADRMAAAIGYLQRPAMPGLDPLPWERPDTAAGVLQQWTATAVSADVASQRSGLQEAHERAQSERRAIRAALLAASTGDRAVWLQVQAMVGACRIAADSEERRKVIQMRFLRLARQVTTDHDQTGTRCSLADLTDHDALSLTPEQVP